MQRIDSETVNQLIDANWASWILYARQWSLDPEDTVQESLIKLVGLWPPPNDPLAWMYRVIRNQAISARRRRRRRVDREAAASTNGTWFQDVDHYLDAQTATEALRGLPDELREVVVVRLWGGLTFDQIAAVCDISTSSAHRRYEQGIALLQTRLHTKRHD